MTGSLRVSDTSVALGVLLGLFGAWAASRVLEGFLFEISPLDPVAYVAAVRALGAVEALGCYLPARRATAVDSIRAQGGVGVIHFTRECGAGGEAIMVLLVCRSCGAPPTRHRPR